VPKRTARKGGFSFQELMMLLFADTEKKQSKKLENPSG
jgi:hypothetical protein